jgi:ubiquinone/menaquinone biosynthesis C-methylase UbiE
MDDIGMWNAAAARYHRFVSEDDDWRWQYVLCPAIFRLLGEVSDCDVLDAGCGQGWLSLELARRGARVAGADAAANMLSLARAQAADERRDIAFVEADLCRPLPFASRSFDIIVSNMVLMDIADMAAAVAEFARVVRPRGRLVISITHPSFFMWCWERSAAGDKLWKPVDDYLTARSTVIEFWGPTRHYHRPLSHYTSALSAAGFVIDELLEPLPVSARTAEHDHLWRVPDFLMIRALPRAAPPANPVLPSPPESHPRQCGTGEG